MPALTLTKHHGLGNDFLVLLDPDGNAPLGPTLARALCERHTGIGADGMLRATVGTDGAALRMELRNADGSTAEMSGNGIRCLAQAAVDAGLIAEGEVAIATDAGVRHVVVSPEEAPGRRMVSVDMGPATEQDGLISMGNPHEVVVVDHLYDDSDPGHPERNVERIVTGPEPDAITMRVWERGVGETLACGTGACAAAFFASRLGLVGNVVTVHQRGGDAIVELKDDTIILTGPAVRIATVQIDVDEGVTA